MFLRFFLCSIFNSTYSWNNSIMNRKKNLDTGEFMPIILSELRTQNSELRTQNSELRTQNSELRTQNSELRTQNSELRTGELFLANYIKYIQAKDRCVGMRCILCAHFRHGGLFAFKRNFSECSFFAWGAFRKIPNADFFIRELSEKFQRQTFCLGSVWKNSALRLSS